MLLREDDDAEVAPRRYGAPTAALDEAAEIDRTQRSCTIRSAAEEFVLTQDDLQVLTRAWISYALELEATAH